MARTEVPPSEARIVYLRSGGFCAFPGCTQELVEPGTETDKPAYLGKIAHIVADSRDGPRGDHPMSDEDRDRHPNLLLLCGVHHDLIDIQKLKFSVSVLRQMKADHEGRIRKAAAPTAAEPKPELKAETIHSSLLPVTHLPQAVFAAPCGFRDGQADEVRKRIKYPADPNELVRFLLRDEKLFSFHDLRDAGGPFADVIDRRHVEVLRSTALWDDAEGHRRYVDLLNRAMFKHADRLGVRYDPTHYRYYFQADKPGEERSVSYRPLNTKQTSRLVIWEPKRKATGEGKGFWWHLGAGIRFHRVVEKQWCVSLRPERHLTSDGITPLAPKQIGRRVTSLKAKMYNDLYLSEINFWRDYLSGGTPRILLNFGQQSVVIGTQFLSFGVDWPGIPGDDKAFKNQAYADDLFTLGEFAQAVDGESFDWEEDDDEE
ncbi:MAG TPA: hypothetical protein PKD86_00285 [Gemmatales bacterium]|nr:hypothetical protein [Gemmatales bacterium]